MKQVVSRVWDVLWSITETAAVTTQEALSVAQRTRVCVFDFFFRHKAPQAITKKENDQGEEEGEHCGENQCHLDLFKHCN